MAMRDEDIDAAIDDRLAKWGKFMRERRATPMLFIGVDQRKNELVLTTVNEMTDGEIARILLAAVELFSSGKTTRA
jgi:hypothetical protein